MLGSGAGSSISSRSAEAWKASSQRLAVGTTGTVARLAIPATSWKTTRLNSPDKTVLGTLREGDVLEIELRREEGPPGRLLARCPIGG